MSNIDTETQTKANASSANEESLTAALTGENVANETSVEKEYAATVSDNMQHGEIDDDLAVNNGSRSASASKGGFGVMAKIAAFAVAIGAGVMVFNRGRTNDLGQIARDKKVLKHFTESDPLQNMTNLHEGAKNHFPNGTERYDQILEQTRSKVKTLRNSAPSLNTLTGKYQGMRKFENNELLARAGRYVTNNGKAGLINGGARLGVVAGAGAVGFTAKTIGVLASAARVVGFDLGRTKEKAFNAKVDKKLGEINEKFTTKIYQEVGKQSPDVKLGFAKTTKHAGLAMLVTVGVTGAFVAIDKIYEHFKKQRDEQPENKHTAEYEYQNKIQKLNGSPELARS